MKVSTNVVQRIYFWGKHDMFKGVYWGISEEPLKGGRVVGGGTGGKGGRRRRRRRIRRIRRRRRRRRQRS